MIVLTILKVIGGILLLFLLLILLLLAVILLVPIRYASDGYKGEELTDYSINFTAEWLMKIVRFKAVYTDEGLQLLLKVLWITLMKSPEDDESGEGTSDLKEEELPVETEDLEETESQEDEAQEDEAQEETEALREEESAEVADASLETGCQDIEEHPREESVVDEIKLVEETELRTDTGSPGDLVLESDETDITDEASVIESSDDIGPVEPDNEKEPSGISEQSPEQSPEDKKSNSRHIIEKTLFDKIKEQFAAFIGRIKDVVGNINKIREQINDPENQKAVGLLVKNVRYLIKHYKFRVLKGHFVFGSDDPATVGQVMIYLSILHPVYGRNFQIEPVFTRPVMKGDMYFKGHIRLIHLLISIVELMMNEKIRLVVTNHFKGDNDG